MGHKLLNLKWCLTTVEFAEGKELNNKIVTENSTGSCKKTLWLVKYGNTASFISHFM